MTKTMTTICGRCGRIVLVADILLMEPGRVVRHFVFCTRWTPPWRSTVEREGQR